MDTGIRNVHPFLRRETIRRGLTLVEVVVVLFIISIALMAFLLSLPKMRERARMAACQRNLSQIGIGLALYDRLEGSLPAVPNLTSDPYSQPGPLKALLDSLALPDLAGLVVPTTPPERKTPVINEIRWIPGFICPSEVAAAESSGFPGPVCYRATSGDQSSGKNGGFAPGRKIRFVDVEDGDGLGFTAAFSERRLGTGSDVESVSCNYNATARFVGNEGCPASRAGNWKGDGGRSWVEASWRSTLYNHTKAPNASPDCIAGDGGSAEMGASSAHSAGVNVLMFDGSVRTISPSISLPIWKALATTSSPSSSPLVRPEENEEEPR